jgi:hypothetical protein
MTKPIYVLNRPNLNRLGTCEPVIGSENPVALQVCRDKIGWTQGRLGVAGFDWALFITGYREDALAQLMHARLDHAKLERHGAAGALAALYRMDYALTGREAGAATNRA